MEIVNKKAYHDYFVEDTYECGIVLRGNEIKSIRSSMVSLKEAWVQVQDGNLVLRGMNITKWETANDFDVDPLRERILLAHKSEIRKISESISADGYTVKPLKLYFVKGRCKVLVGVCKGKHNYDKREALREKQQKRDIDRALKVKNSF